MPEESHVSMSRWYFDRLFSLTFIPFSSRYPLAIDRRRCTDVPAVAFHSHNDVGCTARWSTLKVITRIVNAQLFSTILIVRLNQSCIYCPEVSLGRTCRFARDESNWRTRRSARRIHLPHISIVLSVGHANRSVTELCVNWIGRKYQLAGYIRRAND